MTGSSAGSAAASGYLLKPQGPTVNFSQYVNQRVRVTGVLENGSPAGSPAGSAASPGSPTSPRVSGQAGQSAMQTFTVTSIQPLGGSCP